MVTLAVIVIWQCKLMQHCPFVLAAAGLSEILRIRVHGAGVSVSRCGMLPLRPHPKGPDYPAAAGADGQAHLCCRCVANGSGQAWDMISHELLKGRLLNFTFHTAHLESIHRASLFHFFFFSEEGCSKIDLFHTQLSLFLRVKKKKWSTVYTCHFCNSWFCSDDLYISPKKKIIKIPVPFSKQTNR